MSNHLNWGLLSTARINRRIIPPLNSSPRSRLTAVASRSEERALEFAARWRIPNDCGSYRRLLESEEIDAVYIPLPNSLHYRWVLEAVKRGKHVLCEKPLALRPDEAETMIAAAEDNGVVLLEAVAYRMHPQFLRLIELVKEGAIGRPRLIRAHYTFTLPEGNGNIRWSKELGGGVLRDVGGYPVSFCRGLAGNLPERVFACQQRGPSGVDTFTAADLIFPGGLVGRIDCSFSLPYSVGAEVVGDGGRILVPNPWQPDTDGKPSGLILIAPDDSRTDISTPVIDPYLCEIEAMEDAALDGNPLIFSP